MIETNGDPWINKNVPVLCIKQWPSVSALSQFCLCFLLELHTFSFFISSLQVKDQEFPFNRDLARILVAVEDTNDNIPYFTNTIYDAIAYETFSVGTSVLQVTALDKDKGMNGQLTYTIEAGIR